MADAQHDAAAAIAVQPAAVADPADADLSDADPSDADTSDADPSDADPSDAEWVSTPAGNSALACLPLSERVQRLQLGTLLIKVTSRRAGKRFKQAFVRLSTGCNRVTWDEDDGGGKLSLDLNQVMRISVGLETPLLISFTTRRTPRASVG